MKSTHNSKFRNVLVPETNRMTHPCMNSWAENYKYIRFKEYKEEGSKNIIEQLRVYKDYVREHFSCEKKQAANWVFGKRKDADE